MTNQPALKSSPALAARSTSSTSPNLVPPPSPPLPVHSPPSASAAPTTLHTQAAPSLHRRSLIPSQPNRTNPVVCARQTTQPPPAWMTWPSTLRRLPCTRCATSLHPHPLGPAYHHAAQTARRRRHCPVSAIQAPQTLNANANASVSPAVAAASRSIAVANAVATQMTAHQLVQASILQARVRARKSTRGSREGEKPSLLRIMRASQDTWRQSLGTKQLRREGTQLRA